MQVSGKISDKSNSAWRNPWVIAWVGLVVAVLGVNLTMVYFAVSTNPGLVDDDYYERGQDYEKHLASRLAKDPGWTLKVDIPAEIVADRPTTLRAVIVDKAGRPVHADAVTFYAFRPSDKTRDFSGPMQIEGEGRYAVPVAFPMFGHWDWLVAVTQGADEYSTGGRLIVAKP